jgi:hypothetical protein
VAWLAFDIGGVAQTLWLWRRSRHTMHQALAREGEMVPITQADLVGG